MKHYKNVKQILLIAVCMIVTSNACSQERRDCRQKVTPHIEEPRQDEDGELHYTDTLNRAVRLVFEKGFNDTITIMLNTKVVFNSRIATGPGFHDRRKYIDIDYSNINNPYISIIRKNRDCCWFYIKPGKRVAYIVYSEQLKMWDVELTNIERSFL